MNFEEVTLALWGEQIRKIREKMMEDKGIRLLWYSKWEKVVD